MFLILNVKNQKFNLLIMIHNYNYNLGVPFQKNSVKAVHKYQNLYVRYVI